MENNLVHKKQKQGKSEYSDVDVPVKISDKIVFSAEKVLSCPLSMPVKLIVFPSEHMIHYVPQFCLKPKNMITNQTQLK